MRSLWSGSLSFGLINIPVRLYSASEERVLNFDMLHNKDLSPIRFARICKEDEKEVPYKDIVKGYEYQKGEYVVVTEEDFKKAAPEKSNTIEIVDFVSEDEIDTIYFEKPYYLEPDKNASKPYALLREALKKSHKVGVVKYVFRNKEHIGVIKPHDSVIVLNQLRYASEVRSEESLKLPKEGEINKKEIDMALKLIDQLTGKFKAESYKDTYTNELMKVIEQKIKGVPGKKGKIKKAEAKPSKVHDIMSLLKASLESETEHKPKPKTRKKAI